jgi:GlpG protein
MMLPMRDPTPPVTHFARYPVTAGVCLLATAVTVASMKYNIEPLVMSGPRLLSEPWRLLTSALPHGSIWHLAFNVYWTWVFGTILERRFGHLPLFAIILLLAAASAAAEFAFLEGGIGLSGVGYGLFGILWILSRRDPTFANAIDQRTITLFIAWFFLCIVMTYTNVMRIANIAHGAGALVGALVGWIYIKRKKPQLPIAALTALLALIAVAAFILRPYINFSQYAGEEYAIAGDNALTHNNPRRAIELYDHALKFRIKSARWYYNKGVALAHLDDEPRAAVCFRQAHDLDPANPTYKQAYDETEAYLRATQPPPTTSTHPAN